MWKGLGAGRAGRQGFEGCTGPAARCVLGWGRLSKPPLPPTDLAQVSLGSAAAAAAAACLQGRCRAISHPDVSRRSVSRPQSPAELPRVLSQPGEGCWGMGGILAGSQGPWARANGLCSSRGLAETPPGRDKARAGPESVAEG